MVHIIVRRQYAYVAEVLRRVFAEREDIKVIVDRRHGERRQTQQLASIERRQGERRRPKGEILEVVIGEPTGL